MLRLTQVIYTNRTNVFAYGAITLLGRLSQYRSTDIYLCNCSNSLQKAPVYTYYPNIRNACRLTRIWFGLVPFRSPLLRESLRFLFLGLLRCFTSPGSSLIRGCLDCSRRVAPFGYLRIADRLRLPGAFRSLLRPSSAVGAKASTVCP